MQTQVTFQTDTHNWRRDRVDHMNHFMERSISFDEVPGDVDQVLTTVTLGGDAFLIREWLCQWWGHPDEVDHNFPQLKETIRNG